ncbi:MAG: membrane protein insertion efficiency factor YidD [Nitrospirota bacterium]|nr:membrane protein insertion efficiency factor YidD [Nitrospirota bacterium]
MMQRAIRFYQRFLSPLLPASCRFYPSCSEYSLLAFKKYPFHKAFLKSIGRILKCHPLHPGGVDMP